MLYISNFLLNVILTTRKIDWESLPETRCEYIHVRSDAAPLRHTVSDNDSQPISQTVNNKVIINYIKKTLLLLTILLSCKILYAGGIYQQPEEFIKQVFDKNPASLKVIWPDKKLQQSMTDILGHKYQGLRIRYWIYGTKTAWVLDEIGKEKPITTGIVINHNKIELVKILAFRESRGWEVKHDFFTKQFENTSLEKNMELNRNIDNISGATLSVRAVTKLARIALLLHQQIIKDEIK